MSLSDGVEILLLNAERKSQLSSLAYNLTSSWRGMGNYFCDFPRPQKASSSSWTALSGPGVSPVYIHKHLLMRKSSDLHFCHNSFNLWPIMAICSLICRWQDIKRDGRRLIRSAETKVRQQGQGCFNWYGGVLSCWVVSQLYLRGCVDLSPPFKCL